MDIIKELKDWCVENQKYCESGIMMSMSESTWGEIYFKQILQKIKELEEKHKCGN